MMSHFVGAVRCVVVVNDVDVFIIIVAVTVVVDAYIMYCLC